MKYLQYASLLLACHATAVQSKDILDIAKDPSNGGAFDTLVTALQASGLAAVFDQAWYCSWWPCPDYTVFAPTNDAFDNLPNGTLDRLLSDDFGPHLRDLLLYHAVNGEIASSDIADGAEVETLNRELVTAGVGDDGGISLNADATVVTADIDASNGVVHAIDEVLLPESATSNIGDIARKANFTTLVSLLTATELEGLVADPDEVLTVFAPTNEAFDKLLADGFDATDAEAVAELLKYHIVRGEVKTSYELLKGGDIETAQGSTISVDLAFGWGKFLKLNGDVHISRADVLASNGIVHVIDTVLGLPEPLGDIAAVASGNPDFSILVEALAKAELVETLAADGPFTVFAPTNAAFEKAGINSDFIEEASKEDLAPILLYHVAGSKLLEDDIASGIIRTNPLAPTNLLIDVTHGWWWKRRISLNEDVHVTSTDVLASNGVVHVIDTVLEPPKIIVDVIKNNPDTFSTLLGYLSDAFLVRILEGNGPFTVFAPTNDAFEKLGAVDLTPEQLKNVLLYHVVPGNVPSAGLEEGEVGTAFVKPGPSLVALSEMRREADSETFSIHLRYSWWGHLKASIMGDGNSMKSSVVDFDTLAANGVIHAINKVLLPNLEL